MCIFQVASKFLGHKYLRVVLTQILAKPVRFYWGGVFICLAHEWE